MVKLIRVSTRDILRNYYFFFTLLCINFLYTAINNLPVSIYNNIVWRMEAAYVCIIILLIIPMMYPRYGDCNRNIINNVIFPKMKHPYWYNFSYISIMAFFVFTLSIVTSLGAMILFRIDAMRNIVFSLHLLIITYMLQQIYVNLLQLIGSYLVASAGYLLVVFLLILYNAPGSYLWFEDSPQAWMGKGIIIALTIICHIVIIKFKITADIIFDKRDW